VVFAQGITETQLDTITIIMQLTLLVVTLLLQGQHALGNVVLGRAQTTTSACPAEKCFSSIRLIPVLTKPASSFCSAWNKYTPTVTRSTTITTTTTISTTKVLTATPAPVTLTATNNVAPPALTATVTCATVTSVVTAAAFPTSVIGYVSRDSGGLDKRAATTGSVAFTSSCGSGIALLSKISSACSCFLAPTSTLTATATNLVRTTVTVTSTNTLPAVINTVTVTNTLPPATVTNCQTYTSTTTVYPGGSGRTCGVPIVAYTTGGTITCDASSTTAGSDPQSTNARFRIEGSQSGEGTIFDGPCIASGPEQITTPSGGTHLCDGTNNNNNPAPGGTLTTQINQAGRFLGFDFDGTYSNQFQDFFITRISQTTQTGSQYWGVMRDRVFTNAGGCQEYSSPGEGLWQYDAFNMNAFLQLGQEYAVVQPGQMVQVTVFGTDGNGAAPSPVGGAAFAGQTSDANGNVLFAAPTVEGCYKYKAIRSGSAPSPAFWLTVTTGL